MAVVDVALMEESRTRYLTYALSVVNSRALPDVRDGLKPVQRRILYAMSHNLHLYPSKPHRKSAAVVGEVLARYHPHGDSACYDALVRMAQNFSYRYTLIDGQGNFGSLDGDAAAAYRYTEARLTSLAMELIGDIGEDAVAERDNFDQTVKEPVVLPSRFPNLLVNGCSGIAVGMATAIPPHNLKEVVKAAACLVLNPDVADSELLNAVKGPDFPTGCAILNTRSELKEIYRTGRGAIRMRAEHVIEEIHRGKHAIVVTHIPYSVDKSSLVEKIADAIVARKVPQLIDIRDESTAEVRIVMELAANANPNAALAFLYKHTPLQNNFNVNMTALVPTTNPLVGKPSLLSLREVLSYFAKFRISVTISKLLFEQGKLATRIHVLEGLIIVIRHIKEVIDIVRKSKGRSDSAAKLEARFSLTEVQAFYIVDLRIYQLSKTSMDETQKELDEKTRRVCEIELILKSDKHLRGLAAEELDRIADTYGDARRCKIVTSFEEVELDIEDYIQEEDVFVIVTRDGWLKRIRNSNDPETTRIREGDELFYSDACNTRDCLALFTSHGNLFVERVYDIVATSGFGVPVQKIFRFGDGEQIVSCMTIRSNGERVCEELLLYTERGLGLRLSTDYISETKKTGKRVIRLKKSDRLVGVCEVRKQMFFLVSAQGYGVFFLHSEVPLLSNPGKGVILQKMPEEDSLVDVCSVYKKSVVTVQVPKGTREVAVASLTIGARAKRGFKVVKRGGPVKGIVNVVDKKGKA